MSAPLARSVVVSAWAVPVLVVGQFALLAVVPVTVVLVGVLRRSPDRLLRTSAVALAAAYAVPLVVWALREDPAQSLSKDIDLVPAGAVVLASVAVLVALATRRRRDARAQLSRSSTIAIP